MFAASRAASFNTAEERAGDTAADFRERAAERVEEVGETGNSPPILRALQPLLTTPGVKAIRGQGQGQEREEELQGSARAKERRRSQDQVRQK